MILWKYIKDKLLEHPNQLVCEGNAKMTYEELCVFAENHGKNLKAHYNGILCGSEMATAMALLACFAAEKIAVPMPTRYGKEHYMKILDTLEPTCVITDSDGEISEIYIDSQETRSNLADTSAVILFTSGSTGAPKGVMLSEENLIANVRDIKTYMPIGKDDTVLITRPLYHSSVLTGEFLTAIWSGAKIVFSSEAFQPLNILNLIKSNGVTFFGTTPTLAATLSRFIRKENELPLRILSISGECITEGVARTIRKAFPKVDIFTGYGLSEASPRVAYLPPEMFDSHPVAAGFPVPSVSLRIVDAQDRDLPLGEEGELLVQGPNVMDGYFKDPLKSRKILRHGWLHTGDIAYVREDGLLYIKGRKDDMIIRAGMNIYPAEIENALSTDNRIRAVQVYGYEKNGTQEIGLIVCGNFLSVDDVMVLCRSKLPSYQLPSKIEITKQIERMPGGKRKRKIA